MNPLASRRQIVIAGGGTAGWMAAAALSQALGTTHAITLVESEEIGRVGVGEATIPPITTFHAMLGLDEDALIRATQASFKLGIEFRDWGRIGDRYLHPFGDFGFDLGGVKFRQVWQRLRADPAIGPLDDYCLPALAARAGRMARASQDPREVTSQMRHALHFDAALYADFLRSYAQARGVVRLEGRIARVDQHAQTGDVSALALADGRSIPGDLFVDCTGFSGLLIEQTLHAGYVDWRNWLPNDRAFAAPCARTGPFDPVTVSTARAHGWQWRIPLQHRVGNGLVYSSAFISDDMAREQFLSSLESPALQEPRQLHFTGGHRRQFWVKNVVALGLAAGFLEPLESTAIHLVQTGITRLLALFPAGPIEQVQRDTYNRLMSTQFERIRDFLIVHFHASSREDSPYWRANRAMTLPDSLQARLELWRSAGRFMREQDELFTDENWTAVLLGQHILPQAHDPLADALPEAAIRAQFARLRELFARAVSAMPTHADFIAAPARAASEPAGLVDQRAGHI